MNNQNNPQYIMPAEWEQHRAVWLAWPYDDDTFPDRVEKAEAIYAQIITVLHKSETVNLLVIDEEMKARANEIISRLGDSVEINFYITDYADVWLRDTGPLYVKDRSGRTVLTKWVFNSWGNKFPELLIDGEIPERISKWTDLPIIKPELVLEGGAIDVNGQGICLTTEQCLLNENRNPGMTKVEIEQCLKKYLGIKKTIWLRDGLVNDHTDGHVDELARFVAPGRIVASYEEDERDENFVTLNDNYQALIEATDLKGKPLEIIKLPMPHLSFDDGGKAPVSYTNFYIGNQVILAPTFNDMNDRKALEILEKCFPERRVFGIDCSDIIYGGGAIHCITQQAPK